ncbi:MAG: translation initiation factor IF-2 subunit gamma, partial [Candidatus Norongarragalinales archaeon]
MESEEMAQAEVNIMTAGHVDHGKTTLVAAITGKWASTHSEELKRGITIRLGYADAEIRRCRKCGEPSCWCTTENCPKCGGDTEVVRKVSFVDAPGHETLLATVIAASSIIDGALFVIAANEKCPQPQTTEHLMVLEAAGVKNIVVAQNKVDLVSRQQALENYNQIKEFLKGTSYEDAEIIPTAANQKINLDALLDAIQRRIPTPARDKTKPPKMYVARSFDVNKPGTKASDIKGGVVGGSLLYGVLRRGDEIEILPGIMRSRKDKISYHPIKTRVVSLHAGSEELSEAGPGGLIAVETTLDPAATRADSLIGSVLGKSGTIPEPKEAISVEAIP